MKSSESKLSHRKRKRLLATEGRCVESIHAALVDIASAQSRDALCQLEEILSGIRRKFDPTTVTMTSTNIPDAVTKLSSVLEETGQAAQRVFQLVERQKGLLKENESYIAALEGLFHRMPVDSGAGLQLLLKSRTTQIALREVSHEIVMAQGFQDLCGQRVEKVIRLIGDLDGNLRALLGQFKCAPSPSVCSELAADNADIEQSTADDILKGFGI
jgi:chemotaxis protein CheZ